MLSRSKKFKRGLSLLLVVGMLITLVPMQVFAAAARPVAEDLDLWDPAPELLLDEAAPDVGYPVEETAESEYVGITQLNTRTITFSGAGN